MTSECGARGIDVGPCRRPSGHPGWHETNPSGWGPVWKYGWLDEQLFDLPTQPEAVAS